MNGFGALELLARAGFLVKGVLYLVVGTLALQLAGKVGGRVTGMRGAFTTVLAQPFGRTLLLVAAVGLLGYAAWRILQGLFDPDRLGHSLRGLAIRVSFVARGVVHAALGLQAFRLYRGLSASSATSERAVAIEAFGWPFGDWFVVLAGLGLIGFAVQQVYAAITGRLERDLDVAEMRREAGEWAVALSRFGVAARAIVFALLGWGIVVAGWFRDASEVGTTASSLRILAAQPGGLGRWLLGATAAGFVAYGFYQIIHARYLHIRLKR
ncbi:MAG TPA: DUF1206 domain-containing protein [Vicinamibacterales bacterium]|nr:DUF1206 domain-containing protein [Vicinamibacterales bacterium]